MPNAKKFLDQNGLTYFARLLNNYPNNAILSAVIDAIEDELNSKVNIDDIDDTVTQNSDNPVSSDAVYNFLSPASKDRAFYSENADNMSKIPTTETIYFTHTVQHDGDYIISCFLNASYDAGTTVDRNVRFYIKKNGSEILSKGRFTTNSYHLVPISSSFYASLQEGDVITLSAYCERDNCTPYGIWYLSIAQL